MVKKKKKTLVDIRLFLFRNIKKTFKYYFKTLFYVLFVNFGLFFLINYFLKVRYAMFVLGFFSTPLSFNIAYYGSFIVLFYTLKVILYGNVIYIIKSNGSNDLKYLLSLTIKRYFPTLGTFMIYIVVCLFLSLLLIIPGVVSVFYYVFSLFLCAVGDINNKNKDKLVVLNGGKALGRSYALVKGNLLRFACLTTGIIALVYFLDRFVISTIIQHGFILSNFVFNSIRLCIYDIIIIYFSLMFVKFQSIENDVIEEEFKQNNQEEQAKMNKAAVNNFGKGKK